jgi:hypothetical protein
VSDVSVSTLGGGTTDWVGVGDWFDFGMDAPSALDDFIPRDSSSTSLLMGTLDPFPAVPNMQLHGNNMVSQPRSTSSNSSTANGSPELGSLEDSQFQDDILYFEPSASKSTLNSPSSQKSSPPSSTHGSSSNTNPSKVKKRTLNTLAARRYRQRRVDQVTGLETTLKETETERDELKLKVARLEAEVEVLRSLVRK